MPIIDDSPMMTRVAEVAVNERTMSQVSAKITTNISGISVAPSLIPVSANALLSIDTPVRCTSMSGYSASINAMSPRAWLTACGTSIRSFSGYCSTTLIAVTLASCVSS